MVWVDGLVFVDKVSYSMDGMIGANFFGWWSSSASDRSVCDSRPVGPQLAAWNRQAHRHEIPYFLFLKTMSNHNNLKTL
jgi:hypothetical protein